jgi:hypothetical protein
MENKDKVKETPVITSNLEEARDILRRFVIRARRIEAHSMVADQSILQFLHSRTRFEWREGKKLVKVDILPENEEIFESLAARLRPCLVKSEPIYFEKVFRSIEQCRGDKVLADKEKECLDETKRQFENLIDKTDEISYSIEIFGEDGEKTVGPLSNLLIGDAWMYSDLVHADPNGAKAKALNLSYRERYFAATSFFAILAVAVVNTLRLITELNERLDFGIPADAWTDQVVTTDSDQEVNTTDLYVFPEGTEIAPEMDPKDIPGVMNLKTLTDARWFMEPRSRALAAFYSSEGKKIKEFRAICMKDENKFTVLVNDAIVLELSVDLAESSDVSHPTKINVETRTYQGEADKKEETFAVMNQSAYLRIAIQGESEQCLQMILPLNQVQTQNDNAEHRQLEEDVDSQKKAI